MKKTQRKLRVRKKQWSNFQKILKMTSVDIKVTQIEDPLGEDSLYILSDEVVLDFQKTVDWIGKCRFKAGIVFSLWTTGNLYLDGFQYPTRQHYRDIYGWVSIDHKLPKYLYPELTFDISNWNNTTHDENMSKGNSHSEYTLEYLEKFTSKLLTKFDEELDKI